MRCAVRFQTLDDSLVTPLSQMLRGIEPTFRPFEFTPDAIRRAIHEGDEHWVICSHERRVYAYGMLRGWADGYVVPALGVAVDLLYRRKGLATAMIMFLHYRARERGATHVMLHVDEENLGAKNLYRVMGYREEGDRWVCLP